MTDIKCPYLSKCQRAINTSKSVGESYMREDPIYVGENHANCWYDSGKCPIPEGIRRNPRIMELQKELSDLIQKEIPKPDFVSE